MTEITSGIGDLLQRLRKDGVEAGESEKQRILGEAEAKARSIVADAEKKARDILAQADAEAQAKRKRLDADLSMAARDFASRLTERVKRQVIEPLIADNTKAALGDTKVLEQALLALVGDKASGAHVTVSPDTRRQLEDFFKGALAKKLASGSVELASEDGLTGFRLQKAGDSFTWDVTADAVAKELSTLVEPALKKYFQLNTKG